MQRSKFTLLLSLCGSRALFNEDLERWLWGRKIFRYTVYFLCRYSHLSSPENIFWSLFFFLTSFKSCIDTEVLCFLTSVYGIYMLPFQLSCFTSAEMAPCHVIPSLRENKKVQLSQVTQMTAAYLIPLEILASTHHQEDLYTA